MHTTCTAPAAPAAPAATCDHAAPAPLFPAARLVFPSEPPPDLNVASAVPLARRWAARNAARAALRAARDAYERADDAAPGENTPAYLAARDRWAIARHRWHNFLEGWG